MKFLPILSLFIFSGCLLSPSLVLAKQWAIVVGINTYTDLRFKALKGAVNDAELLAATFRERGVDLPDNRLLLNEDATVVQFKSAWNDLLKSARSGDELIVTFAGHGGQEQEFAEPYDEQDHKDETLVFYGFDSINPLRGRIADDELYELFEQASAFSVLFVADTCHAGGLNRSVITEFALPLRGSLNTFNPQPRWDEYIQPKSHDNQVLPHVTYLAATDDESRVIHEISVDDAKAHGALSWSFARAFRGEADQNNDQIVTRLELEQFIGDQVPRLTAQRQFPGMLPRGNDNTAFSLIGDSVLPIRKLDYGLKALRVKITGGNPPGGIEGLQPVDDAYVIQIEISDNRASAFNAHGDRITGFTVSDVEAWRKILAKYRLLQALDGQYNRSQNPVRITLKQGNNLHHLGESLNFSLDPGSKNRFMLLFDLSGTGELQFLYPFRNDNAKLTEIPFQLDLEVDRPTGEDDIVAIFCGRAQPSLVKLLGVHDGKSAPRPEDILSVLGPDCQIGRYAFFTEE